MEANKLSEDYKRMSMRENPITWVGVIGSIALALSGFAGNYLLTIHTKLQDTMVKQQLQDYAIQDLRRLQSDANADIKEIKNFLFYGKRPNTINER